MSNYNKLKQKIRKIKIINSDVYCSKCGRFLGMICDPFREGYCEKCFPKYIKTK